MAAMNKPVQHIAGLCDQPITVQDRFFRRRRRHSGREGLGIGLDVYFVTLIAVGVKTPSATYPHDSPYADPAPAVP